MSRARKDIAPIIVDTPFYRGKAVELGDVTVMFESFPQEQARHRDWQSSEAGSFTQERQGDHRDCEEDVVTELEQHYAAGDIEERILAALRAAGLNPDEPISPEELGALDHFHTGGRRATLEFLDIASIQRDDRVLDVGAGLGGPARLLAATCGCRVVCLDQSPDYCRAARLLNRLTRLDDRIEVRDGSALDVSFPASSFDVVWMQNVAMNIPDKRRLYSEIRRVLKPGGRFAFQEVAAGEGGEPYFPLPWATLSAQSFLVPASSIRSGLEESGFVADVFEDTSAAELARPPAGAAQGPLTVGVFAENIGEKLRNAGRGLEEGRTRPVRGVFRAA